MHIKKFVYQAIKPRLSLTDSSSAGEDAEHLLEKEELYRRQNGRACLNSSIYVWTVHIILLLLSSSFFLQGIKQRYPTDQDCVAQLSAYSPALGAVEYKMVRFQGALLNKSPYKGAPSPEIDAAWDEIVNMGQIKVHPDDLKHLQKPTTQAKLRTPDGEWYTGGLEVFHQLHCVNLIRQYTYLDYYHRPENRPPAFTDSNETLRLHIDHCIDMLRQVVQCQGDVGIVTSSWVAGFPDPYPDFNSWHKCRNFKPLNDYTQQHLLSGHITKTSEDLTLSRPPCEGAGPEEICP
ncbi:hypothetical protein BGW36DRAFT_430031 [Talaromyces proteolyticus]|uniref:Tat pathway signal sequence n=1 Tax=Talaromyces proteolyticus TaxID=1131652 RepID=A0AAD4KPW7_9EURO|nr:uncharacterized protein BGW36DRAFT_430031 [Talaromyces proteolyticus]KAH8694008.1 hypothetical protein BGW36DRAFT_430031 [Talaromyces proteolyticus]